MSYKKYNQPRPEQLLEHFSLSTDSLSITAMVLLLLPQSQKFAQLRSRLEVRMKALMRAAPSVLLQERLLTMLSITSGPAKGEAGAAQLAHLISDLFAREAAPGGPYAAWYGESMLLLNVLIREFFLQYGLSLPVLENFLYQHCSQMSKDDNERFAYYMYQQRVNALPCDELNYEFQDAHLRAAHQLRRQHGRLLSELKQPWGWSSQQGAVYAMAAKGASGLVDMVRAADAHGEISLMSLWFHDSLQERFQNMNTEALYKLGAANVHCWAAYVVYDDFLDGEGSAVRLSPAHRSMRTSLELYGAVFGQPEQYERILWAFDSMDAANEWELKHCRAPVSDGTIVLTELPDYGDHSVISNRAWGHVAGIDAMIKQAVFTKTQQASIRVALHHYLVARQYNDDLHDWVKDLSRGQLSPVVCFLLQQVGCGPGEHNLDALASLLRRFFWSEGHERVHNIVQRHVREAQKMLTQSAMLREDSEFHKLISQVLKKGTAAMREHNMQKQFLKSYRSLRR